jgi:hypothetical protein
VPSSLHLWKVLAKDNQLTGKPYFPSLDEVTGGLVKFYDIIERDLASVPQSDQFTVSYESLQADPIKEVQAIYNKLGLNFTADFKSKITDYLEKEKDFKKNSYNFDEGQKEKVFSRMKKQFGHYHYSPQG